MYVGRCNGLAVVSRPSTHTTLRRFRDDRARPAGQAGDPDSAAERAGVPRSQPPTREDTERVVNDWSRWAAVLVRTLNSSHQVPRHLATGQPTRRPKFQPCPRLKAPSPRGLQSVVAEGLDVDRPRALEQECHSPDTRPVRITPTSCAVSAGLGACGRVRRRSRTRRLRGRRRSTSIRRRLRCFVGRCRPGDRRHERGRGGTR